MKRFYQAELGEKVNSPDGIIRGASVSIPLFGAGALRLRRERVS